MSTRDRPMAGSTTGGGLAKDRGFFPFSVRFGAMAIEKSELESDWKRKQRYEEAKRLGSVLPAMGK